MKLIDNLNKNCVKIGVTYIERVEEAAMDLFYDYKPYMDKGEQGYVESWIKGWILHSLSVYLVTFCECGVKYMKYNIKQAKRLKLDLERIGREEAVKMDKDLITKLDIKAMYPSITYKLVTEVVRHYTEGFSEEDKMRVEGGWEMLKFSMSNCLINFGEEYFQYRKEKDSLKRALPIGGFDSAWLADLVACYILERTEQVWKN